MKTLDVLLSLENAVLILLDLTNLAQISQEIKEYIFNLKFSICCGTDIHISQKVKLNSF